MSGSRPGANFYHAWEELGAVQGRQWINQEEYIRFEGEDGKVFSVYTDIDRLERHVKELAPEDEGAIDEVIKQLRSALGSRYPRRRHAIHTAPLTHSR